MVGYLQTHGGCGKKNEEKNYSGEYLRVDHAASGAGGVRLG